MQVNVIPSRFMLWAADAFPSAIRACAETNLRLFAHGKSVLHQPQPWLTAAPITLGLCVAPLLMAIRLAIRPSGQRFAIPLSNMPVFGKQVPLMTLVFSRGASIALDKIRANLLRSCSGLDP
jgi:hypothetical protein